MSNTDFEARLRRIAAQERGASASAPMVEQVQGAPKASKQKPHRGMIALAALCLSLGVFALRKTREHYDALKEADKPEVILGLGMGGAIMLLISVVVMLSAVSKSQPTQDTVVKERRNGPKLAKLALGALCMLLSFFALRAANSSYDALKATDRADMIAGLGFGGAITLLLGTVLMLKAFSKRKKTQHTAVEERREASTLAQLIFTFCGLAMGAIACLYMFAASAARHIDTQTAQQVYHGGQMIVLILLCLSLLFGFVGMFLRGYALGRVPVYFVVGAVVTYFASGFAGLNLLEWQPFVAAIQ